jgi:hypothetical protein
MPMLASVSSRRRTRPAVSEALYYDFSRVVIHDLGGASVTVNSVVSVAHNSAIPPLVPQYASDNGPLTAQFVTLEDALTNLLSAERLFLFAMSFGTAKEKQGTFGNLVNAFFAYETAIFNFDMRLPGA